MNQQFQGSRAAIHKCITGLTEYAAQLAAQRQEETIYQNKYLAEVSGRLHRSGFSIGMAEDGILSIVSDGHPLCAVNGSGGVRRESMEDPQMDIACDKAVSIVKETAEYMKRMRSAPILKADGLSGDYRLLAEFNNVVFAGHERESYGTQFITWERTYDGTGLWQGHYMENNYAAARQEFAVRSGLVDQDQLFSGEQLAEMYRCIQETLDSEYPMTDSRRKILESACTQIEDAVPNLDELVQQSNQEESALADSRQEQELFF